MARGLASPLIAERPDSNGTMRAVTADDSCTFVMQFASGALATATAILTARNDEASALTIYGAEGTLRFTGGELHHAEPGAAFQVITPAHSVSFPEGIAGDFPQGTVYLGHACVPTSMATLMRWLQPPPSPTASPISVC
ncbi:hypothetical protein HC891_23635 [Candidatus Gracilibacteria bacterium]|nr:hypothetical protein [Candidatus Gracilibacteria bacterium]